MDKNKIAVIVIQYEMQEKIRKLVWNYFSGVM